MADAQNKDITGNESASPESRPEKGGKKKKKKKGCGFFIMLTLLIAGVAAGIQATGGMDFRPYIYSVIPRIPGVGEQMASLLKVPEIYSMSTTDRRRIELDEWERAIARTARSLDQREGQLEEVSGDLTLKGAELERAQAELAAKLEALERDIERNRSGGLSAAQQDEIADTVKTFEAMSPKNAAAIIEKLNRRLAVAVLDGLPEDFRAKALGKMEAGIAAELMEQLTQLQRTRGGN